MKVHALIYNQKDKEIFVFSANPHDIYQLANISDISKSDKNFQRPYDQSRVDEIKRYVLGKDKLYKKGKDVFAIGYIPNSIVINLPAKYKIVKQDDKNAIIHLPDISESSKSINEIEIIDGQHRLLAFDKDCVSKLDKDKYEMCFVAFQNLSNNEKKEIFMVLNERQKSVDKNILLRHKKLLKLLLEDEETRYDIIARLNGEDESPFYKRIILAGEKIKNGFKAKQIDDILSSSKALDSLIDSKGQITDNYYKIFRNYLNAWKTTFPLANQSTLWKISGIRFICNLFPYIYEVLSSTGTRKSFRVDDFSKIIDVIRDQEFNKEFDLKKADKFQFFQDKTSINRLAISIGKEIKEQMIQKDSDILV